ncbi:protein kinase domain-containing protein [Streptomyces oceani]|uniref:non-specific serine/threonine protein kinase n=1 Tax=Streptomyces oceani TaxID=1075402 RepID=A0A1E7JX02_9ACTN|nr:protein kinase [Streptomyces oceani]OEU96136.1 serine/threonine protein kinase [Streptomyces oceani]
MSQDGAQDAGQYIGRTIGGRFQLQSLLGAGGMASVYLAYDSVLDRQVAVKTLHTDLGREQSFRERFRREAQSVAKLTHTNIVSVFDSGEDEIDGAMVPYIVMEYVEGKPLRSVLDEDIAQFGAMPADKALKIVSDVVAALDVSHEMGLVHRDIKPGNVMVTRRGVVKVMDFGIARAMESGVTSMTQTGMVVGTPQYLSPEQALGRGVDARSDLYSVGIMLFELVTGRLPFDADSPLAIAYAHVQEEPVMPSSINQSVPQTMDALVARALKKNPNERFPSAEVMLAECSRVASSGTATNAMPTIVSSGPGASGAGLGQAVFPPVGTSTPPPPGGVQPYQSGQYGGYAPATPPPTPAYGYPNQQTVSPYGQQGGASPTLPPNSAPATGGGQGGKNNMAVIVGSAVVAIIAVTAVIVGVTMSSGDSEDKAGGDPSASSQEDKGGGGTDSGGTSGNTPTAKETFKGENKNRTIDSEECTDAREHYSDKDSVNMPELTQKNLASVKACLRAAGWPLDDVTYEDENEWGKNTVLEQSPDSYDAFNPKKDKVELTVSTGKP